MVQTLTAELFGWTEDNRRRQLDSEHPCHMSRQDHVERHATGTRPATSPLLEPPKFGGRNIAH